MENCEYSERKEAEQHAEHIKSEKFSRMENFFKENYKETFYVDTLDAEKISEIFFPSKNRCNVFISHSHSDIECANYISYLFHKKNINAFIDSQIWGNMDELLWKIDNIHCKNEDGKTYSYEKRNISTSHVHMILFSALINMINTCECFFFLDTQNSIQKTAEAATTFSPWIMGELLVSSVIKPVCPRPQKHEIRAGMESLSEDAMPSFEYSANVEHLKELPFAKFRSWYNELGSTEGTDALDALYEKF